MKVIEDGIVLSGSMDNMFYAGLKVFVDNNSDEAIVEGGLQKLLKTRYDIKNLRDAMLKVFESDTFIMSKELKDIDTLLTTLINKKLLSYKLESFYTDYIELGQIINDNNLFDTLNDVNLFKKQMIKSIKLVDDISDDMYIDSFSICKDFNVYCLNMSTGILYTERNDFDDVFRKLKFRESIDINNMFDVSVFNKYLRSYIVGLYPNTKNIKYAIEVNTTNKKCKRIL